MDGLKLSIQKPDLAIIENNFYNGWTHSHYVNCLFLFCPDGKIRASLVYKIMKDIYAYGGGNLLSTLRSSYQLPITASSLHRQIQKILINFLSTGRQITSVRQLSEWGMRMVQGAFCCKLKFYTRKKAID